MRILSSAVFLTAALLFVCVSALTAQGIRIENGQGQSLYFFSEGMMYRGDSASGKSVFMFNPMDSAFYPDNRIIARKPLATWKDNALYRNDETGNPPMFIYYNGGVHPNGRENVAVAYLDGCTLYKGPNTAGQALFRSSQPLPVPVMIFLLHFHKDMPAEHKVYAGKPGQGKVVMLIRNHSFYLGSEITDTPAFTMDPVTLKIYRGSSVSGKAVYSIGKDNKVYRGDKAGNPADELMKIEGYSFYLPGKTGEAAVASFAKELPLFVKLYPGYIKKGDPPKTQPLLYLPDVSIAEKFFIVYKLLVEGRQPQTPPAGNTAGKPQNAKPAAQNTAKTPVPSADNVKKQNTAPAAQSTGKTAVPSADNVKKQNAKPAENTGKTAVSPADGDRTSAEPEKIRKKSKKKTGKKKKKTVSQENPPVQQQTPADTGGWE